MIRQFEGTEPTLADGVFVDEAAVVIGDVVLGEDSSVWPMAVIRGDVNQISIGARSNIQDGSILHVTHAGPYSKTGYALEVGDDVTIGHQVTLHGCTIESACLIGMGAIVMDGAVVESGAMVAAGALVSPRTRVTGGWLWKGSPARAARELTEQEREFILYSAGHYVRLAQRHVGTAE